MGDDGSRTISQISVGVAKNRPPEKDEAVLSPSIVLELFDAGVHVLPVALERQFCFRVGEIDTPRRAANSDLELR